MLTVSTPAFSNNAWTLFFLFCYFWRLIAKKSNTSIQKFIQLFKLFYSFFQYFVFLPFLLQPLVKVQDFFRTSASTSGIYFFVHCSLYAVSQRSFRYSQSSSSTCFVPVSFAKFTACTLNFPSYCLPVSISNTYHHFQGGSYFNQFAIYYRKKRNQDNLMEIKETTIYFYLINFTFPFIKIFCLSVARHRLQIILWF